MPLNPRIEDWRGRRVWLVGASSGIGAALAAELSRRGARVLASARDGERLAALEQAGGAGDVLAFDATDAAAWPAATRIARERQGGFDAVLYVAGTHKPMRGTALDVDAARALIEVNYLGAVHCAAAVVPELLRQGSGGIGFVASVAGYRALPTGIAYGASKAATIHFAEGLHYDLAPHGLAVWLVNPGFVRTPLTDRNEFPMPALIETGEAARQIVRGIGRGAFEIHFPRRFTLWLKLLRWLPQRLYDGVVRRVTGL